MKEGKRSEKRNEKVNSRFYFEDSNLSLLKSKRSQVTLFVIIALLIVGVLLFAFYPQIKGLVIPKTPGELVPRECMEQNVEKAIEDIMAKGGSINPELYYIYENETIDYLCYTGEWYKTCVMQKPFLKQSIEEQVILQTQKDVQTCINKMIDRLESKGYSVKTSGTKKVDVNIIPKAISISYDIDMSLQRGEEKMTLKKDLFRTEINSNTYDMIMIASSIQNFEARYGDSNVESYMALYPNIKVEKKKQSDGTKIYIITERNTEERLVFATRSLAWPPGYAEPLRFADGTVG